LGLILTAASRLTDQEAGEAQGS